MWVWGEGTKKRGRVVKIKNGKPWSSGGLVDEKMVMPKLSVDVVGRCIYKLGGWGSG